MWSERVSPLGGYRPGHSFLHRIDPRVKLLLALILIVAAFARPDPFRLALLTLAGIAGARLAELPARSLFGGIRTLRWLLLFTVLLHALFSPGHTLFGLPWLSREGLLQGLLASWGLVLALLFSTLLTLATAPEQLAAALSNLLKPLERLGIPVTAAAEQVLLVLYFIPLLHQEAMAAKGEAGPSPPGWSGRLERTRRILADLLERLTAHAEQMVQQAASGETVLATPASLPPVSSWGRGEWLLLLLAGLLLARLTVG